MTIRSKTLTLATALLVLTSNGAALAEGHEEGAAVKSEHQMKREKMKEYRKARHEKRAAAMLDRVDVNNDGQVDLDEYLAHAEQRFTSMDADANGYLTADEARESMQKMRKEHKERRKKMREERLQEETN